VVSPEALRTPASKLPMPIADDLPHHMPRFWVHASGFSFWVRRFWAQSRQRTANKQPRGPTAIPGDQASDLQLLGSGGCSHKPSETLIMSNMRRKLAFAGHPHRSIKQPYRS
jgi:hypothetical protein